MENIALLLMAYGSIEKVDELEPYLLDIRSGRPMPPPALVEIRRRYEQIGGRSPLLEITCRQASALESSLNRKFAGQDAHFQAFVGMRHWQPRIKAAVEEILAAGFYKVITVVMAPQQSAMSSGAYYKVLDEALQAHPDEAAHVQVERVPGWHNHPAIIAAFVEQARAGLAKFEQSPYVLFSAHSLPQRNIAQGDPYDSQVRETASLVAESLGLPAGRWGFCYQSAGQSPEPWLGPSIDTAINELAGSGEKNILVVPVGFVCDHIEILYDLDIAAKQLAAKQGVRLERSPSLNDSPTFISALTQVIEPYAHPLLGS